MTIPASVQDYLERKGIRYELIRHPPTRDAAHTAQEARVPEDRLAQSVVLGVTVAT
jgi:hypothetical protein